MNVLYYFSFSGGDESGGLFEIPPPPRAYPLRPPREEPPPPPKRSDSVDVPPGNKVLDVSTVHVLHQSIFFVFGTLHPAPAYLLNNIIIIIPYLFNPLTDRYSLENLQ